MIDEIGRLRYDSGDLIAPAANYLKQLAYKDEELPSGMVSAAQSFYLKARALYRAKLEPEQGKHEMLEIERIYELDWDIELRNYKIAELWLRIDEPARVYGLNPTIDNADKFYAAVYNLPDSWRQPK